MTTIYYIVNNTNNKRYVGITDNVIRRWKDHQNFSIKKPTLLKQAMKKHGLSNFDFQVLEEVDDRDTASVLEQHYINEYNTLHPHGYNLTSGGDNSYTQNNFTRQKISQTMACRKITWRDKIVKSQRENLDKMTEEERSERFGVWKGKTRRDHNTFIPSILDDYDTAYKLYITEGKTQDELVEITGLTKRQVAERLSRHKIYKNKSKNNKP